MSGFASLHNAIEPMPRNVRSCFSDCRFGKNAMSRKGSMRHRAFPIAAGRLGRLGVETSGTRQARH
jgi:hypothetical protein